MIKTKFSISVHIMTLLAMFEGEWLTSSHIAGSLNVNPVLVRKELSALKLGGLIESKEGKNGGVRILKNANKIKMADIFNIAKGSDNVLSLLKNTPNPKCVVGKQINEKLKPVMSSIDIAISNELGKMTLEEFKNGF